MLRVTPLYGSRWSAQGAADDSCCTLIEYGGASILWNVGWKHPDDFPTVLPPHDCLLLTSSSLACLGSLPLYYQRMQRNEMHQVDDNHNDNNNHHHHYGGPPIYATYPTVKMGQMTLYDSHAQQSLDGQAVGFSLEQLDDVMASITSIKYSQSIALLGGKLSITAHRAGHVVGAAFFILQRIQDETQIVVTTSQYHIAKELHLDGCTLLQHGSTPDVLITYPGGPAFRTLRQLAHGSHPPLPPMLVTQAQRNLVDHILSVLRRDGNVLLPTDASGRVLELLLLLDRTWDKQRLGAAYQLVWVAPMAMNTLEFARSQLEWMNGSLGHQFDSATHPFALKHVQKCTTMRQLDQLLAASQNPTCVISSGLTLDHGCSRDVLVKWADNPDNAIVFTDSSGCTVRSTLYPTTLETEPTTAAELPGTPLVEQTPSSWTVAGQLLNAWAQAKQDRTEMEDAVPVDVPIPFRHVLTGAALQGFLQQEEVARQKEKQEQEELAMLRQVEIAKGELRLEQETETTNLPKLKYTRPRKKSRFDSTLFLKFSKPLHLSFELREEAIGIGQDDAVAASGIGESRAGDILEDDYGIAVIPERFTDIVSGVDPSKFAGSGRIGEQVLRRGLGYAVDSRSSRAAATSSSGAARVSEDEGHDEEDGVDEHEVEAIDLSEGKGIIRGRNGRPPSKVSTVLREIDVLAEVSYIPLEGRVDARAARQSVRALQPRQVIVLGGPKIGDNTSDLVDEVSLLSDAAYTFSLDKKLVPVPSDGETAELDVGHAAYAVRLIDAPYQAKEEKEASDEPPEPIELVETKVGACTVSLVDSVATGHKLVTDGSIVLAPRVQSTDESPKLYISNGEILLTDLRAELIAAGLKVEYSAHTGYSQLVVNGKVIIKKASDSGAIDIEGPLCEDFFTVRSMVCGQFVTL